jgi:hypothetical protein
MRLVTLAAASVLALGALLGGFTAFSGGAAAPQHSVAAAISVSGNNNGNG